MKKLFPILMVLVLGLAACSNGNGSQYAGKYVGTFKFIKDSTTKQGSVRITNNPLSQDGVLLYAVLPLNNVSTGKYSASSENVEYMSQILQSIFGSSNYIDTATEQVKNIKVDATFEGNTLNMVVYYEVQMLSGLVNSEIRIVEFTGTK
ncbi:MAG: hypothetical protein MJZ57_03690 [Bacteroidales bacterium]|nr:hypothetical protein [Bacteroidales bacterium]